ncbi:MAG: DEDD exonuclease domain-containing protein [Candidatus Nanopelagicales bacterium]|nr:DEDD exonuclease domain-containing protein [Candidatus Nanopelagicales bacterium]
MTGGAGVQASLDDIGTPLCDVTFVVVDLETTGGPPTEAGITEIGAVKMRNGEVLGEFSTLVNPGQPIPPFIIALTGITNAAVANAPSVATAVSSFLEFSHGSVLVAHNASYDISFLKGASARFDLTWPTHRVVDTARLARVTLQRDEVRNCKLGTLAAYFAVSVQPTHRAFDDARATVEVLHKLLERAGDFGVATLEDLSQFTSRVSPAQRSKRTLADRLPERPGVYIFRDELGTALYIGKSLNIRQRARSYFTAAEQRKRMSEMISIAATITPIVCASELEAQVREVRLIHEEQPRYNVRSRRADIEHWISTPLRGVPRLTISRNPVGIIEGSHHSLGPFSRRSVAQEVQSSLEQWLGLNSWATEKSISDPMVSVRQLMSGDARQFISFATERMHALAAGEHFEEAAAWRERLEQGVAAIVRMHRLRALSQCTELVAAMPTSSTEWEVHVIRSGYLAAAGQIEPHAHPGILIDALVAAAAHVEPRQDPAPAGLTEEAHLILNWLERPGVRIVRSTGELAWPIYCGGGVLHDVRAAKPGRQGSTRDGTNEPVVRPVGPLSRERVSRIASS